MITADAIVKNVVNGRYYKVRSVSLTKAVCRPCTRTGKPPAPALRAVAVEFKLENLRLVRIAN